MPEHIGRIPGPIGTAGVNKRSYSAWNHPMWIASSLRRLTASRYSNTEYSAPALAISIRPGSIISRSFSL